MTTQGQVFHAALVRLRVVLERATGWALGDDIFISYAHRDATSYATGLANVLAADRFACRFDQWAAEPGPELPASLIRALRRCKLMVVVGSREALGSGAMLREIERFRQTQRPIVTIDCSGAIRQACWWELVRGPPEEVERPGALASGEPAPEVVARIDASFEFLKRDQRLRIAARWIGGAAAVLLGIAVVAGWYADRRSGEAAYAENLRRRSEERLSATRSRNLGVRARMLAAGGREIEGLVSGVSAVASELLSQREPHPDALFGLWSVLDATRRSLPLEGHSGEVTAAAFLNRDRQLVTGDGSGTLRFWDAESGELLDTYRRGGEIAGLAVSARGDHLLAAGAGPSLWLRWNGSRAETLGYLEANNEMDDGWIGKADFSPVADEAVVVTNLGKALLVAIGSPAVELGHREPWVTEAFFSPDGEKIITRDEHRVVRIFDAAKQRLRAIFGAGEDWTMLSLSPWSNHYFACRDGSPWIGQTVPDRLEGCRELSRRQRLERPLAKDGPRGNWQALGFSPGGVQLAAAEGEEIWLLNLVTGDALCQLVGIDARRVERLIFSPNGDWLITVEGDMERRARLWRSAGCREVGLFSGYRESVLDAAFASDGGRAVTTSRERRARVWRLDGAQDGQLVAPPIEGRMVLAGNRTSCREGRVVTLGDDDSIAEVWSVADGRSLSSVSDEDRFRHAELSPDGEILAAASRSSVHLWRLDPETELEPPLQHQAEVLGFAWLANSRQLVTVAGDKKARLWAVDPGREIGTPMDHDGEIGRVAASPEGGRFLTVESSGAARLWEASAAPRLVRSIDDHRGGPVVFSPSGEAFLTLGDSRIGVWRSSDGAPIRSLQADEGEEFHVAAWSPDSSRIVTGSRQGRLRHWDAESGEPLSSLQGPDAVIGHVAFGPVGELVVAAVGDTVQIRSVEDGTLHFELEGHSAEFCFEKDRLVTTSASDTRIYDVAPRSLLQSAAGYLEHRSARWESLDGKTRQLLSSGRADSAKPD